MYMSGFPNQYSFLQGFPGNYNFLQGLGTSTSEYWMSRFLNPFTQSSFLPAVEMAKTDKAAAYAKLAPAFAKFQQDVQAWINSNFGFRLPVKVEGQQLFNQWKTGDGTLIQGYLNDWATALPSSQSPGAGDLTFAYQQPSTAPGAPPPAVSVPSVSYLPVSQAQTPIIQFTSPGQAESPAPAAADAATGDTGSTLMEWIPWIAGAALVGLMVSSSGKRRPKS